MQEESLCPGWPPLGDEGEFVFPCGISVFFPTFNDGPSLPALLARTFEVLRRYAVDYEVIVINDGSTDETGAVLERLRAEYAPQLRVVTHEQNRGYGAALRSGFANARKEFVFYTDGDGQYDPGELPALLRRVGPQVGLVNGYKIARQDPPHRTAIGWLYNRFARFVFGVKLRDIDCDFRLIRRSLLEQFPLTSTSGTVCVELVRKLELLAGEIVEVPVHHYPRLHGRSQFFRLRSLAATLLQLCHLFLRLVVLQAFHQAFRRSQEVSDGLAGSQKATPSSPWNALRSRTWTLLVVCLVAALCFVAYLRALSLPFIADDYVQLQLAQDYGPVSAWSRLAGDVLYRCRATSLVLTYWTARLFGFDPVVFNISSLLLHILNSWLVFALGRWRVIGWRASAVAACLFAVCHQHQEAVIWDAALPELLVFFFSLLSLLFWLQWLQSATGSVAPYVGSAICFLGALLSKESAVVVVPLMVLAALTEDRSRWRRLRWTLPFAVVAILYFLVAYLARNTHLHFNDGTFSLQTPFWRVVLRSTARLLWFWGFLSLTTLALWREWRRGTLVAVAAAWIGITLVPYSFLTYMPYVPSRHTYFASVGWALILAAGLLAVSERAPKHRWAAWALAATLVAHHCTYLWTRKHAQFLERAAPTERLIQYAQTGRQTVYLRCFPYDKSVAELALQFRFGGGPKPVLVTDGIARDRPDAIDLCAPASEP